MQQFGHKQQLIYATVSWKSYSKNQCQGMMKVFSDAIAHFPIRLRNHDN
jgi:hypothetical protein